MIVQNVPGSSGFVFRLLRDVIGSVKFEVWAALGRSWMRRVQRLGCSGRRLEAFGLRYKLLWDFFYLYKMFVKFQLQRNTALRRNTNPQRKPICKLHVIMSEMFEQLHFERIAAVMISKLNL